MKVIDLDSHSRPRTEDYVVEPEYFHLRPRVYVDAKGSRREVFNNRIVTIRTSGELAIAGSHGKADWRAANYDGHVRYKQIKGMLLPVVKETISDIGNSSGIVYTHATSSRNYMRIKRYLIKNKRGRDRFSVCFRWHSWRV